eukprot:CAMPEP_0171312804 /NCGR_PEP_ID=MMETSP0816-20121228/32099_1 /TAXON_ID=420281 /ORGANISM="Proboscia inermis, Strain CCAP1064/1" /LENGTH=129 /DNA_ID=CAMNT_0011798929 /DNA_START=94 /DNA_END=483 /DNA_ORIENTATION=+
MLRRSVAVTQSSTNALRGGGGGPTPPVPPFARIPLSAEKLVENHDAIWDDGVAAEATIDFDCQHVPSTEGLLSWLGGLAFYTVLYNTVAWTDPESKNPAVNRQVNMVVDNPRLGHPEGSRQCILHVTPE